MPKYLQQILTPDSKNNTKRVFSRKISSYLGTYLFIEPAETEIEQINTFLTGTATHDGTAIAQAVVQHLKNKIKCRTMFVTHFKSIIGDINAHMGFLSEEEVLFLYKVNIRQLDFFVKTEFL